MKKNRLMVAIAVLASTTFAANAQTKVATTPIKLNSTTDSLSYAIGVNVASSIKQQELKINPEVIAQALKDFLNNNTSVMTEQGSSEYIQKYFMGEKARQASENKAKGDAFLAKNKSAQGVTTLPNGLQYKVITAGTGPKPTTADQVKVHYEGRLIEGKVFDSSYERKNPATFGLTQVIKGWTEALQLMPVGSKWTLYIPSDLAYGMQAPPIIGPNQVLVFDVELLEIVK